MQTSHERLDGTTSITLLGVLQDVSGRRLNVADFGLPMTTPPPGTGPIILVCGTSMNAGKTHSVVSLVRGLVGSGQRVAEAGARGAEAIVMEIADRLRQAETAAILADSRLRSMLAGTLFAAGDAMAALAGVA